MVVPIVCENCFLLTEHLMNVGGDFVALDYFASGFCVDARSSVFPPCALFKVAHAAKQTQSHVRSARFHQAENVDAFERACGFVNVLRWALRSVRHVTKWSCSEAFLNLSSRTIVASLAKNRWDGLILSACPSQS